MSHTQPAAPAAPSLLAAAGGLPNTLAPRRRITARPRRPAPLLLAIVMLTAASVAGCGTPKEHAAALPGQQVGSTGSGFGVDPNDPNAGGTPDFPAIPEAPPDPVDCNTEGQQQLCFDGAAALADVGACKSGTRTCKGGFWTPCMGQVIPVPEYCDFRDNDCDGVTDEGVKSSCGDCNPYCAVEASGAGTSDPLTLGDSNAMNLVQTNEGWLTLTETAVNLNVIWIANSAEGTVSKLDTQTGYEVGRYVVCGNPSRTAVGKFGDGWIACRSDNSTVAYIINFEGECIDRNGNGQIDTSRDLDGDHKINKSTEMLPKGQDECVKWVKATAGVPGAPQASNVARALGVDYQEHAWVGHWDSSRLVQVEKEEGLASHSIAIPAKPYGLTIDQQGIVWVSGRGGGLLVRVDPNTDQVDSMRPNPSYSPYGIAVDEFGRIWTPQLGGSGNKVYMYDPNSGNWTDIAIPARGRGVVASGNGRVFVACDQSNKVAVIDLATLTKFNEINLGGGHFPIGMAVDSAGFIWAVNQQSGTVHKINGQSLGIVGNYPVGKGPYTYSDMTGSAFFDAVPPGWYRHRFEARHLGGLTGLAAMNSAQWGPLTVNYAAPPGAYIKFRIRTGDSETDLESALWTPLKGPFPDQTFPVDLITMVDKPGRFLEVEVWLYPSDDGAKPLLKGFDLKYESAP